jgi:hypothetical protein
LSEPIIACSVLVDEPESKGQLGKSVGTWKDNIRMEQKFIGYKGVGCIHFACDTDEYCGLL